VAEFGKFHKRNAKPIGIEYIFQKNISMLFIAPSRVESRKLFHAKMSEHNTSQNGRVDVKQEAHLHKKEEYFL
jgi:hypothetical protein